MFLDVFEAGLETYEHAVIKILTDLTQIVNCAECNSQSMEEVVLVSSEGNESQAEDALEVACERDEENLVPSTVSVPESCFAKEGDMLSEGAEEGLSEDEANGRYKSATNNDTSYSHGKDALSRAKQSSSEIKDRVMSFLTKQSDEHAYSSSSLPLSDRVLSNSFSKGAIPKEIVKPEVNKEEDNDENNDMNEDICDRKMELNIYNEYDKHNNNNIFELKKMKDCSKGMCEKVFEIVPDTTGSPSVKWLNSVTQSIICLPWACEKPFEKSLCSSIPVVGNQRGKENPIFGIYSQPVFVSNFSCNILRTGESNPMITSSLLAGTRGGEPISASVSEYKKDSFKSEGFRQRKEWQKDFLFHTSDNEQVETFVPQEEDPETGDHSVVENKNSVESTNGHFSLGVEFSRRLKMSNSELRNDNPIENALFSPFSFQPQTTPSIHSPIPSSRLSGSASSTGHVEVAGSSTEAETLMASRMHDLKSWALKTGSASRRIKSSDSLFGSLSSVSGDSGTGVPSNFHAENHRKSPNCSKSQSNLGREASSRVTENLPNASIFYGGQLEHNPFKVNNTFNNSFFKMPRESIGLFKTPLKPTSQRLGNSLLEPYCTGRQSELPNIFNSGDIFSDESGFLNRKTQHSWDFAPARSNTPNGNERATSAFNFGSVTHAATFSYPQIFKKDGDKPSIKEIPVFQFTTEKPKRVSSANLKVSFKYPVLRDHILRRERNCSKDLDQCNTPSNISQAGADDVHFKPVFGLNFGSEVIGNAHFKPSYGSDVKFDERGISKNVTVRYQNIVFMKEYLQFSPEELRAQLYAKGKIVELFKFTPNETQKSEKIHCKKFVSKEVQTEENGNGEQFDLSGIWRVLECPVCLDVAMPPVYQCEKGHHACQSCWNKIISCPLCKGLKSKARNYMAENLVEQISLPCRYHIEGCLEKVRHANKLKHEEDCVYRMYPCPVPSCKQAHCYQNMCRHFSELHNMLLHHEGHSIGKGEKFCDILYKGTLSCSLIHAFNITKWGLFFLREATVTNSHALFIQVMPASFDHATYFYHLEVCDHKDCRKECYKGKVYSFGKPLKEIIQQEEYLSLSQLLMKTTKKTAPLKIIVTIWQLKPGFTLE